MSIWPVKENRRLREINGQLELNLGQTILALQRANNVIATQAMQAAEDQEVIGQLRLKLQFCETRTAYLEDLLADANVKLLRDGKTIAALRNPPRDRRGCFVGRGEVA